MKTADYLKTLIPAAVVLFAALQQGGGFLLLIILPLFLVAAIYSAVRMIRSPAQRKDRCIRLAIWAIAFALAGGLQGYRSLASRNHAESARKQVAAYKERTGRYPASLGEAGLDERYLKDRWRLGYSVEEGRPALVYPAPFVPLSLYEYDFETGTWRLNAY